MKSRTLTGADLARVQKAKNRIMEAAREIGDELSPEEWLATFAWITGAMVAMQDQRTMTPARAMQIVSRNVKTGNAQAMAETAGAGGLPQ